MSDPKFCQFLLKQSPLDRELYLQYLNENPSEFYPQITYLYSEAISSCILDFYELKKEHEYQSLYQASTRPVLHFPEQSKNQNAFIGMLTERLALTHPLSSPMGLLQNKLSIKSFDHEPAWLINKVPTQSLTPFITSLAKDVYSLDIDIKKIPVNSNNQFGSRRGPEVACKDITDLVNCPEKLRIVAEKTLLVQDGTTANVHAELRPVQGKDFSNIIYYETLYSNPVQKILPYPIVPNFVVQGFYGEDPQDDEYQKPVLPREPDLYHDKNFGRIVPSVPFNQETAAPPSNSFRIKYLPTVGSIDHPDASPEIPFITIPLQLVEKAIGECSDDLILKEFLLGFGINRKEDYEKYNVPYAQFPRRLDHVLDMFAWAWEGRTPEMRNRSHFYNTNRFYGDDTKDNPLLRYLEAEEIKVKISFRGQTITSPWGKISFKKLDPIEMTLGYDPVTKKRMLVLHHLELGPSHLTFNGVEIKSEGLKIKTLKIPFRENPKEKWVSSLPHLLSNPFDDATIEMEGLEFTSLQVFKSASANPWETHKKGIEVSLGSGTRLEKLSLSFKASRTQVKLTDLKIKNSEFILNYPNHRLALSDAHIKSLELAEDDNFRKIVIPQITSKQSLEVGIKGNIPVQFALDGHIEITDFQLASLASGNYKSYLITDQNKNPFRLKENQVYLSAKMHGHVKQGSVGQKNLGQIAFTNISEDKTNGFDAQMSGILKENFHAQFTMPYLELAAKSQFFKSPMSKSTIQNTKLEYKDEQLILSGLIDFNFPAIDLRHLSTIDFKNFRIIPKIRGLQLKGPAQFTFSKKGYELNPIPEQSGSLAIRADLENTSVQHQPQFEEEQIQKTPHLKDIKNDS